MKYLLLSIFSAFATSVMAQSPSGYNEHQAMKLLDTITPTEFQHTEHPGAQWYPDASFGLFIHWGIHAVAGGDPSWCMLKNVPWLRNGVYVKREQYYRLAEEFNPVAYDPDKWVKAAKETGFTYIVITAKHHDGYCLWPTEYGEYSTKKYMNGRDLIKPLVEACRKYGIRIGLYFSPRDWSYPEYPVPYQDFDFGNQRKESPYEGDDNQRRYDRFFRYTVGQMSELLTRYGKIDVIWFDGIGWPDVNTHADVLHSWLRAVQPEIVINPRWEVQGKDVNFGQTTDFGADAPFGDFRTEEVAWRKRMTQGRPYPYGEWWEFNEPWSGHWGYSPGARYRDVADVIAALVYARSYGGNYLPDIGPQPDGQMRSTFYRECAKVKEWMDKNRESVIAAKDFPDWHEISNLPLTRRGNIVYVHFLPGLDSTLVLKDLKNIDKTIAGKPVSVSLLSDGQPIDYSFARHTLTITLPEERRSALDAVVKIEY